MTDGMPRKWESWPLSEVGEWLGGGTPTSSNAEYWNGNIPWVSPKDMKVSVITSTQDKITNAAVKNSAAKLIPASSVLFVTRSGILAHSFPVATTRDVVTVNQDLKAIVPVPVIDTEYLGWTLRYLEREVLRSCSKHGTTVHSIEIPALKSLNVPIPPPNEQRRIVTKIENLFSELDKGIEALTTAREQLKVYRNALLKHAFEGKLTEEWRENTGSHDTEDCLNKIGAERIPVPENTSAIPDKWHYVRSGSVFSFVTSGSRGWAKYYSDSGATFIRIGNLDFDTLDVDLSDIQHVSPPKSAEGLRTKVQEGDFLISITGYLGMFAIAPPLEEAYVNQHIALARPKAGFDKKYVGYYIISRTGGHHYLNALTKGAVKAGLGLDDIRNFPIPMCPLAEQKVIVSLIEERMSFIDKLEEDIQTQLEKTAALRQSILKQAFSGQLVAQDPKDEPASVLLERSRAERNGAPTKRTRSDKNGKKNAA